MGVHLNKQEDHQMMILPFGREDVTRTRDPYVPNVVRYQLRHFSVFAENLDYFFEIFSLTFGAFLKAAAKVQLFF